MHQPKGSLSSAAPQAHSELYSWIAFNNNSDFPLNLGFAVVLWRLCSESVTPASYPPASRKAIWFPTSCKGAEPRGVRFVSVSRGTQGVEGWRPAPPRTPRWPDITSCVCHPRAQAPLETQRSECKRKEFGQCRHKGHVPTMPTAETRPKVPSKAGLAACGERVCAQQTDPASEPRIQQPCKFCPAQAPGLSQGPPGTPARWDTLNSRGILSRKCVALNVINRFHCVLY